MDCYLCGDDHADPWGQEGGYHAVKCRSCGLVYVKERPTDEVISIAHQTGEHRTDCNMLEVTTTFSRGKVRSTRQRLERLFPDGKALRSQRDALAWLDVGAGNGETLLAARALFGTRTLLAGVEPNRHKRAHAARQGITISDDLEAQWTRKYDVISLINVFSHLVEPPKFLGELRRHLAPGGSLVLVTGNGGDLATRDEYPDRLDLPDHLSFIGRQQLERLMQHIGFRTKQVVEIRQATIARTLTNVARLARGETARLSMPYMSDFRSLWCRFERVE